MAVARSENFIQYNSSARSQGLVTGTRERTIGRAALVILMSGSAALALAIPDPARANETIDNGETETVKGDGSGTKPSPWDTGLLLVVGDETDGSLAILDGGVVNSNSGNIAASFGSTGAVTVDGEGSNWILTSNLGVGGRGTGELEVTNGGAVESLFSPIGGFPTGIGSAVVDGEGSQWTASHISVGNEGSGSLTASNQATVITELFVVGRSTTSTGMAVFDGAGTSLKTSRLFVGERGMGKLSIVNGAAVYAGNGFELSAIGFRSEGSGTIEVDGAGSLFDFTGEITIGDAGNGVVTLSNGGAMKAASLKVANDFRSVGTVNIGAAAGTGPKGAGILETQKLTFGFGEGSLVFNHTDTDYVLDAEIAGAGDIYQLSGTTNLTGNSSAFVGDTRITGGTLNLLGTLRGLTQVSGSGVIGGTGAVGPLIVANGGTVAPGDLVGTLHALGDVTFEQGSFLEVYIDQSNGTGDLLAVDGIATLNGGTVIFSTMDGFLFPEAGYTFLTAAGGVVGQFDGAVAEYTFLDPLLEYTANAVTAKLVRNSVAFSDVAQTYNQAQTGDGLDSLSFGSPVYYAVTGLDEEQARAAFDSLSGEIHAGVRTVLADDVRLLRRVVLEHMGQGDRRTSVWGEALAGWNTYHGHGGFAGFDSDLKGIIGGVEIALGQNAYVGIAGGYSDGGIDMDARLASAGVETVNVLGYFGTGSGPLNIRIGAGYANHSVDTRRTAEFADFRQLLSASYGADTFHGFGEVGYALAVGRTKVEPFARLAVARTETDKLIETGGTPALSADGLSHTDSNGVIGVNFASPSAARFRLRGTMGWSHRFDEGAGTTDLAFAGGDKFNIRSASFSADNALVDLSAILRISTAAQASVGYRGLIGSNGDSHAANVSVTVRF